MACYLVLVPGTLTGSAKALGPTMYLHNNNNSLIIALGYPNRGLTSPSCPMGCTMALSNDDVKHLYHIQSPDHTLFPTGVWIPNSRFFFFFFSFFFFLPLVSLRLTMSSSYYFPPALPGTGLPVNNPGSHKTLLAQIITIFVSLLLCYCIVDRFQPLLFSWEWEL